MVATIPTEISDIPRFFNGLSPTALIEPVMVPAKGDRRGGFHLILKGENYAVMVYDRGVPAWFSDLGDARFLLSHGYVREVITDEAKVTVEGYF